MITAAAVNRYHELDLLTADMRKTLRKFDAEKTQLEEQMIEAVERGERVEAKSPFKLSVVSSDKRYVPAYKQCALDLAGNVAVNEWCEAHNLHEKVSNLVLTAKGIAAKISKPFRLAREAIAGLTA